MPNVTSLVLTGLIVIAICISAAAASKRPAAAWNYYHFDGSRFIAGQPGAGTPFVAIQDHVLPVVLNRETKVEAVALPNDKGALAGICFIQRSGGKLSSGNGYIPCPKSSITVSSGNTVVTSVETDEYGYFVAILSPGSYKVTNRVLGTEVVIEKGTTVLVPLRTGKRMVD